MEFKLIINQDEVGKIIKLLNTKFKTFDYEIIGTDENNNRVLKLKTLSNDIELVCEFYEVLFEEFTSAEIVEKVSMEV